MAITDIINILRCPICKQGISSGQTGALQCPERHSYDISSKGYVNLINKPELKGYDKALFKARREVAVRGFFNPLQESIIDIISERFHDTETFTMADCGCGEGYITNGIYAALKGVFDDLKCIGLDLSKAGIGMAAGTNPHIGWLVADIANLPMTDHSCDLLLNVLTPANYREFARVLKRGGLLIKVIPGEEYLKEIRELSGRHKKEDKSTPLLDESMQIYEKVNVKRTYDTELFGKENVVRMSPLSWRLDHSLIETVELDSVTLDLDIIVAGIRTN